MTQIAIIITEQQFNQRIDDAVEKAMAKRIASMEANKALPVRLNCKEAAKQLGVSESTFHTKFAHLKRFEGGGVYVESKDLV